MARAKYVIIGGGTVGLATANRIQQQFPDAEVTVLEDLVRCEAGVRAQAISPDGSLVDDFLIHGEANQIHVLNAPSPAATSSLEIAKHICARLPTALSHRP